MIAKSAYILLLVSLCVILTSPADAQQNTTDEGISLYREGRFDQSVAALSEGVSKNSKDKLAWVYLGAALFRTGNKKAAMSAFRSSKYSYKDTPDNVDVPMKFIFSPVARHTEESRANRQSGTIAVAVEFAAEGKVGFVLPFRTLPWGLTENAVTAAKGIRFTPAVKDGKPVTTVGVVTYSFDFN